MNTPTLSLEVPNLRIDVLQWPGRDAEVVRIFVGTAQFPHEVFHIAVSGTAVATLRNHGVEFDLVRDAREYLGRPGVLAALLAESAAWRDKNPDLFFEKCFGGRDLGTPVRDEWMQTSFLLELPRDTVLR